jgi:hypothetical protein
MGHPAEPPPGARSRRPSWSTRTSTCSAIRDPRREAADWRLDPNYTWSTEQIWQMADMRWRGEWWCVMAATAHININMVTSLIAYALYMHPRGIRKRDQPPPRPRPISPKRPREGWVRPQVAPQANPHPRGLAGARGPGWCSPGS